MMYLKHAEKGQSQMEYALLISLIAVSAIAGLYLVAPDFKGIAEKLFSLGNVTATDQSENAAAPTPAQEMENKPASLIGSTAKDFMSRIRAYHDKNGKWPRSWGEHRFSDIGLNFDDWKKSVNGIYWNPNGDKIGLGNKSGDDLQVYVEDLNGNTLHLYDGWNIWCVATTEICYYHTVAPGNEVDINTIKVVETSKR